MGAQQGITLDLGVSESEPTSLILSLEKKIQKQILAGLNFIGGWLTTVRCYDIIFMIFIFIYNIYF
jgi:hypothetical protein